MSIVNKIELLRSKSGNDQLNQLKKFKNDDFLKEIMYYTYNPHLKFKIKEKSLNNCKVVETLSSNRHELNDDLWVNFKRKLDYLANAKGCKNEDIEEIVKFMMRFKKDDQIILKQILLKDLRLGMGKTSINKVWKNLIPDSSELDFKFAVTRLNNYNDKQGKPIQDKVPFKDTWISRKFDGINNTCIVHDDELLFLGRSGKPIPDDRYLSIREEVKKYLDIDNYVYCGEIVYLDENGKDHQHKTSDEKYFEECSFVIFDVIKREEFIKQECKQTYKERMVEFNESVDDLINNNITNESRYKLNEYMYQDITDKLKVVNNLGEQKYEDLVNLVYKNNWEGLVLRDGESFYEYKKSKNIVRFKPYRDAEFEIVGFEEGKGKYEGTLGAIIFKLDEENTVKASGFDDHTRNMIWNKRDIILNNKDLLVKIRYRKESENKKGGRSLTEPTFKGFRKRNLDEISVDEL